MAHTRPLQKLLYKEFVGRLDESEESPQVALPDGFVYYSRKIQGQEYRVHCRSKNGIEDVYLDENKLANSLEFEDASFFRLGFIKFGPSFKIVAYSIDLSGNERYIVKFMMIDTKIVLDDLIDGVYEDLEFSNDSKYVYYTILDEFERAFQLKRHKIGTSVDQDQILCHELDEMFYLSLSRTCDMKYIKLKSAAQITSETSYISLNDSSDTVHLLVARSDKIQYTIEHHDGFFYILSNEDVKNNWLFRIPVPDSDSQRTWKELDDIRECVVEHRDFVLIEDFLVRRNHLIVFERSNCLQNVRIVDLRVAGFVSYHYVSFSELVYSLWPGSINEEVADLTKASQFDTDILRFTYTSFVQYIFLI